MCRKIFDIHLLSYPTPKEKMKKYINKIFKIKNNLYIITLSSNLSQLLF